MGTVAGADHVRAEPFDALAIDLTLLWDDLPPPAQ